MTSFYAGTGPEKRRSTRRSLTNSTGSPFARRSIRPSTSYSPISTPGWPNITSFVRIRADGATARRRCRPFLTRLASRAVERQLVLEEFLAAKQLIVWVFEPARAKRLVGEVVHVLEDREASHQPRRQRRMARRIGIDGAELLFEKAPVDRRRQASLADASYRRSGRAAPERGPSVRYPCALSAAWRIPKPCRLRQSITQSGADQIAGKPRVDRINSAITNTLYQHKSPAKQGFQDSSPATNETDKIRHPQAVNRTVQLASRRGEAVRLTWIDFGESNAGRAQRPVIRPVGSNTTHFTCAFASHLISALGARLLLAKRRTLSTGDIVILDNLGSQKGSGVRAVMEAADARLIYLPPYSPDFNPIDFLSLKAFAE